MGESSRFGLRRPTRREAVVGGLAAAAGAAFLAHQEPKHPSAPIGEPTVVQDPVDTRQRRQPSTGVTVETLDHETYRNVMLDQVIAYLAALDPDFSVTTTLSVNDVPVTDQFFGISHRMPDGNYRSLGTVYPDEKTGSLQFNPDEEISAWVQARTGTELNGLNTTKPEDLTDAATDMLELQDLMQEDKAGRSVATSDLEAQLLDNKTITTAVIEEERSQQSDTGN